MAWDVVYDPQFREWLMGCPHDLQDEILAHISLLKEYGPTLSRPKVDTLKGSTFPNMKELRVQCKGQPWRILFAFDPKRRSILLVGGNKRGDKRWYTKNIALADARYAQHLQRMETEHGHHSR